jgi:hypothetical protein
MGGGLLVLVEAARLREGINFRIMWEEKLALPDSALNTTKPHNTAFK